MRRGIKKENPEWSEIFKIQLENIQNPAIATACVSISSRDIRDLQLWNGQLGRFHELHEFFIRTTPGLKLHITKECLAKVCVCMCVLMAFY